MIKRFIFILFLGGIIIPLKAQPELPGTKVKNFYFGLGGVYTNYQDVKLSNIIYSGLGATAELGFNKAFVGEYLWETGFIGNFSKEHAATHNNANTSVFNINIYFKYLRELNSHFMLGGRMDVTDINIRLEPDMGNNASSSITGTHLFVSGMYKRQVFNENWKLNGLMDVALISYQKDIPSFAMSYSQKRIEEGDVDYHNELMGVPGYSYGEFRYIWNNLNVRTSIYLHFKKRFAFGYEWQIRHFSVVEDYPTTVGTHSLTVRYNITHRIR
jgi:hypothetical protein